MQKLHVFQVPGFKSLRSVLFISHSKSLASDSREFIFSNIITEVKTSYITFQSRTELKWTAGDWVPYSKVLGSNPTEVCCSLATQTVQLLIAENLFLQKNNLLYQTGTRGDLESSLLDNRALSRIWEIPIFPIQIPIFPTVDMPFLLKVKGPHVVTVATVDR